MNRKWNDVNVILVCPYEGIIFPQEWVEPTARSIGFEEKNYSYV